MSRRKILFLGETFRADAQTWINGLKEFGNFEIVTWEMKENSNGWRRILRFLEYLFLAPRRVRNFAATQKPDMIIAERTTSFGYLAAISGVKPVAVAQQGITDIFPPHSPLVPLKKYLQRVAFANADIIHAWGPVMLESMTRQGVDTHKVMVMPKGIDLRKFTFTPPSQKQSKPYRVIVTRSLFPEYRHTDILKAASILLHKGFSFEWIIVGDGPLRQQLEEEAKSLGVQQVVHFAGRVANDKLPEMLKQSCFYVSVPISEGVSSSLFEAMACGCYPVVTDLPGNRGWIRDGENGALVPVNQPEKLAAALESLVNREAHCAETCASNRKLVEEQANFEVNMKKIAEAYHALIDRYSSA